MLFIADGAPWIWKRVPLLVQALGLAVQQVHELLDFYHAVQHLGQVAALRKDWSAKARAHCVPTSAACCCKAKWSRSLALYVTSAEAVTAGCEPMFWLCERLGGKESPTSPDACTEAQGLRLEEVE